MDMLLADERKIISCLSRYGVLKQKQLEMLFPETSPEMIERIFRGLKKSQMVLEDEDDCLKLDPRSKKENDTITAFWVLLKFISKINPEDHYPANYPAQIYFLKDKTEYEIMCAHYGAEHLVRQLFNENRYNSDLVDDMTKYIIVLDSREELPKYINGSIIPADAFAIKQVLFAVPLPVSDDGVQDFEFLRA